MMKSVVSTDYSAFSYELTEDALKAMMQIEAGSYKDKDDLALRRTWRKMGWSRAGGSGWRS